MTDTEQAWAIYGIVQVVGILLMRPFYGQLRAQWIDHYAKLHYQNPVMEFEDDDLPYAIGLSMLLGVFWPIGVMIFVVYPFMRRWVTGTKQVSRWETDHALTQMALKVDKLERELGYK